MLTPRLALLGIRSTVALGAATMLLLMIGPFQGAEGHLGLNDKAAHAIAFYVLTLGLFLSAPNWRRTDLALFALAFGVLVEVAQGLTGREMSGSDVLADALGVAAATAPGVVERLRHHTRTRPDHNLWSILKADRRAPRLPKGFRRPGRIRTGAEPSSPS